MTILGPNSLKFSTLSSEQTYRYGLRLGQLLQAGDILLLQGNLGAGKTRLASGIARGWGAEQSATSPTFLLVNEYTRPDGQILHHLDCYRFGNQPDVDSISLEERLTSKGILVIEWPDVILPFLPKDVLEISLKIQGEERRDLHFQAHGVRSQQLLTTFQRATFGWQNR